jgi:hypothetical protein
LRFEILEVAPRPVTFSSRSDTEPFSRSAGCTGSCSLDVDPQLGRSPVSVITLGESSNIVKLSIAANSIIMDYQNVESKIDRITKDYIGLAE